MTKILHFGITGGIGSGKSYCAHLFNLMGIPVYSADHRAKYLMLTDPQIKASLIDLFDDNIYLSDGNLDKIRISNAIFNDVSVRISINNIVHPAVKLDYTSWTKEQSAPFTLKESALIDTDPNIHQLDGVVVVLAPIAYKIRRLMTRDGSDRKTILTKMRSQSSDSAKLKTANFTIENFHTQALLPQIISIFKEISS